MRLLILSLQYAPEFTSNGVVVTGLARQLAARQIEVTVLAGTPHYQLPRVPPGYTWRPFRFETMDGVKVIRCWAFPHSQGMLAKFLNYVSFTLTSLCASLFVSRPDVVMVVSPPFWLGFSALLIRALKHCRVIYNVQDLFPDAYLASKEVQPGLATRIMNRLMNRIYRAADCITVITSSFATAISARGTDPAKIVTIPNFVDVNAVKPLPRMNSFRERHSLGDRFVVMYAGNIGYTHGTEILVDAAHQLSSVPGLVFLIVGGGSKQGDLRRLAERRELTNMQFLPTQPSEVLPEMLAASDILVITSKAGIGATSFPGRVYNSLLAARPVVASVDATSDLARFIESSGSGIVTPPAEVETFCSAITTLYQDSELRARLGRNGANFMAQSYSPQAVVTHYEDLLKRLASR